MEKRNLFCLRTPTNTRMRTHTDERLLFGMSKKMMMIGELVKRMSDTDAPVLITGESGTGKELVAEVIHSRSPRKAGSFVKVHCATIPHNLIESELFGYEQGAFTGADRNKPGRLEFAHAGTVFLDEIATLPLLLQSKLLRFLQDGEFYRLGGREQVKVDVRIITSTNRDLEKLVTEREFREDLFYRLKVISIMVPPLRERAEEIPYLAHHFLRKYCSSFNLPVWKLSDRGLALLQEYTWPGNVRELENTMRKIVLVNDEEAVLHNLFNTPIKAENNFDTCGDCEESSLRDIAKKAALEAERRAIEKVLEQTRWNRTQAAKLLKISYKTLLCKIKQTGLDD